MPCFPCPYCSVDADFSAPSEELLLSHIKIVHSTNPGFTIQCSFNGCLRTFSSFKAFQNHRRIKHSNAPTQIVTSTGSDHDAGALQILDDSCDAEEEQSLILGSTIAPSKEVMQSFSIKWTLKTREARKLTRSSMEGIIEDAGDLVMFVTESLESETRALLQRNGASSDLLSGLKDIFNGPVTKPFEGVRSFYHQLQYCRRHFSLIVSINYMYLYNYA